MKTALKLMQELTKEVLSDHDKLQHHRKVSQFRKADATSNVAYLYTKILPFFTLRLQVFANFREDSFATELTFQFFIHQFVPGRHLGSGPTKSLIKNVYLKALRRKNFYKNFTKS
jgi:hypothetical protein